MDDGAELLIDRLPPDANEGSAIGVRITRAAIAERGRFKRAQARCISLDPKPGFTEFDRRNCSSRNIFMAGESVCRFPVGMWETVWDAASQASIDFAGGSLLFSVTPAMTVIDIDGEGFPRDLALAAIPAIAKGLRWFDLGGSIAIDFPTVADKADRKVIDNALAEALIDYPHERTAMNGFGLVQIVARLEGPSLLHRFALSRRATCARMALRRAGMTEGAGPVLLLTVHPILEARLEDSWLDELARRTGREVRIEIDPALALDAPQAQIVLR